MDAVSDDGRSGLTIIAFIGSVFSPYYASARKRGAGNPYRFCSINVALYGEGGKRWAMTERTERQLHQRRDRFAVGPSSLTWDGCRLTIQIDEITCPIPSRVRGRVTLTPKGLTETQVLLDGPGRHVWWPIAPACDVEVAFDKPGRNWRGHGYFDSNWGAEPLEDAFRYWTWLRAPTPDGTLILYDLERRQADDLAVALMIGHDGRAQPVASPPRAVLPKTGWRVRRETRADDGIRARVAETLEDTPFYSRSLIETRLNGLPVTAMHESLDMDRFVHPAVQLMLPFKMPRWTR